MWSWSYGFVAETGGREYRSRHLPPLTQDSWSHFQLTGDVTDHVSLEDIPLENIPPSIITAPAAALASPTPLSPAPLPPLWLAHFEGALVPLVAYDFLDGRTTILCGHLHFTEQGILFVNRSTCIMDLLRTDPQFSCFVPTPRVPTKPFDFYYTPLGKPFVILSHKLQRTYCGVK